MVGGGKKSHQTCLLLKFIFGCEKKVLLNKLFASDQVTKQPRVSNLWILCKINGERC